MYLVQIDWDLSAIVIINISVRWDSETHATTQTHRAQRWHHKENDEHDEDVEHDEHVVHGDTKRDQTWRH